MRRLVALIAIATMPAVVDAARVVGSMSRVHEPADGASVFEGRIQLHASVEGEVATPYLRDYSFQADGTNAFPDPGTLARSCAGWIEIDHGRIPLSTTRASTLSYTVRIPDDAERIGTYWGVIMVEADAPQEEESTEEPDFRLRSKVRYAIQVVVNFPEGEAEIEVADRRLLVSEDGPYLVLDLANKGQSWFFPEGKVEVYSMAGTLVHNESFTKRRIYPGCSIQYVSALPNLRPGRHTAIFTFFDKRKQVAARYSFTITE